MFHRLCVMIGAVVFTLTIAACHGLANREDPPAQSRVVLPSTELGYSPDGSLVAFPRAMSGLPAFSPDSDTDPRELWVAHRDGSAPRRLLAARKDSNPERNLETFASPTFALDGHRIYFLCRAWMTSWALHVYDLNDGTEHFIRSAASFEVVSRGPFSGCLLITDHTYNKTWGSFYYPHLVVTPEGVEIAQVGDEGGDDNPRLSAWRQRFMPSSSPTSPAASSVAEQPHDPRCR